MASAGTFALLDREPRQGRKAATVVIEQARSAAGRGHPRIRPTSLRVGMLGNHTSRLALCSA